MLSKAGTGYFYTWRKNPARLKHRLKIRKYDPIVRKHVIFEVSVCVRDVTFHFFSQNEKVFWGTSRREFAWSTYEEKVTSCCFSTKNPLKIIWHDVKACENDAWWSQFFRENMQCAIFNQTLNTPQEKISKFGRILAFYGVFWLPC